jgi:ComF family protein
VSHWGRHIIRHSKDILDFFYPPVCGICGREAASEDRLVCDLCWALIDPLEAPYCPDCLAFLHALPECHNCRKKVLPVFSLGYFEPPLQTIIHDLKFHRLKPLAGPLGLKLAHFLAEKGKNIKFDLAVPVPLHETLKSERGFNQAAEIASAIADTLQIEHFPDALYCARKSKQQAKLPRNKRIDNIRGVFAVDHTYELTGRRVLIVDDVTTTGATVREIAAILTDAGAIPAAVAVAATTL